MKAIQNTGFCPPECTCWHVRQSERRNFFFIDIFLRRNFLDIPLLFGHTGVLEDK